MNKFTKCCVITSAMMLFSGLANAAPTYCSVSGSPNPDGLSFSDMTFNGNNANDCYGVVLGNEPKVRGNLTTGFNNLGLTWGTDWTFLAKDDDPGSPGVGTGSFGGFDFTLTAGAGTNGGWSLTAIDTNGAAPPNFPTNFDFVGMLKASNRYALWFFDDAQVVANNSGTFSINFQNNGGQFPSLSHMNLYIRGGEPVVILEPTTLALFGLGLLGFSLARRQKR
ncbi:PEP-CTERM protein-sorting domain-containing protein [Nitrosomonas sp. Nm51]|uniref:PEP-CTERM sorting domain-containing protein n=1 Tax=Nitrosomonas sp. Nm51 TaxID=133720 RepID=UPI0008C9251D|nr:PEP-CTERM sorting domain-containing protein [Nitrosomonas sp. Nm51]SER77068.1 PEP-CTERM protein-sorting domain-containing protein [Nitrosomonas sp. Nm51]